MSDFKFTLGPWTIQEDLCGTGHVHSSIEIYNQDNSEWLFTVMGSHVGPKDKETIQANAKLIAAAPDMYEAIKSALNIKDLWSAQQHGTVSAEHEGEMLALRTMEHMLQSALDKATV